MFKSPSFLVGFRYILARKDNRFISFTSLISMAGLTLGVLAIIVVLSVFNGSQGLQRERTLITVPHGDISHGGAFDQWRDAAASLADRPGITGVAPYIALEALLSRQGYHQVTEIKAVDPVLEDRLSGIGQTMVQGSLGNLRPGASGIVLGRALAANLRLNTGDPVNLIVPEADPGGRLKMAIHRFTVVGIFDVQFTIGADLALIHLEDSLPLLGLASIGEQVRLRMQVADIDDAAAIVADSVSYLENRYPGITFAGRDWSVSESGLFNALKMEKFMTWFMLMMIVAIGAFNIISTLVMVVSDKQADIAILRTMGASEKTIMGIFVVQGTVVGILGTLLGALLGILLALNFSPIARFLEEAVAPASVYMISALPSELAWNDVWITCGLALLISFFATLYPAHRASRILPAEVLRYE